MYRFTTSLAQRLYETVKDLPIIDFHNHLSVAELSCDRRFGDLTELWLAPDPYKHRAMRILGVEERLITGDAAPYEKFRAWCEVYPRLTGNPLTVWSQVEMKSVFGIEEPICPENAPVIWEKANAKLAQPGFSAKGLLARFPVAYHAPCASFADDLSVFAALEGAAPSLRGDTFTGDLAGICAFLGDPQSFAQLTRSIQNRLQDFCAAGCRIADHALDAGWQYFAADGREETRFAAFLAGTISSEDKLRLDCDILRLLAREYRRLGWLLQLHMGAQRYTSSRLRAAVGPAGGFAGIGAAPVDGVTALLDELEREEALPRTVLFCMDSASYDRLAVLTGSFTRAGYPGYVQLGPAWWWCDHFGGMVQVLESVLRFGCLSTFIGMTTDSRSILSFSRHDYFRRVLCNWLGEKVASGELADNEAQLACIAKKICYQNAADYLGVS